MSDHIFGRIRAWAKDHRDRSLSIGIMLVVFSVGVAALIWDYNGAYRKNVEEITRKTYGKGKRTEELRVEGKDRVLGEIPIEVTEQVYGEQEISQVLKQAVKKMDSLILGENVSLDHVDRDLNLLTEIPGKPIDVTWKLDRYDVINIYGKLKEDKLVSEGTLVKLTAILTYREDVEKQIDLIYEKLSKQLTKVRKDGTLSYLRPDGKTQVTVEYDENNKPIRLDAIVVSSQHAPDVTQEQIHEDIKKYVFDPVLPADMVDEDTKFFINPTGRFVIGGPNGDSGLTGRKIIVDTYGGYARHGGGAFSGKDCTKVDRSAAYAARYVAKNIVAAGLADKCEIQLSYAIGVARPTSIMVDTFGTGKVSDEKLVEIIREHFDLRPAGIIRMLDLRRPIYKQTAAYGHFGRTDLDLPWEKLDKVDMLKAYL